MKTTKRIITSSLFLLFLVSLSGQIYVPADPKDILFIEQKVIVGGSDPGSLMIRPFFLPNNQIDNNWSLRWRNELFYNDNGPNLENTSDRWIGKGLSLFTSVNIAYKNKYFAISAEPYYFFNQNKDFEALDRFPKNLPLNSNRAHTDTPYVSSGVRELQLIVHHNGIGVGYSNANMWWGQGIHNSLMMTNNTAGFGHIMFGTIEEKHYKDWGFNGKYLFSKFGKRSTTQPYYSAFTINATYYSNPVTTIGFSRAFLAGGTRVDTEIDGLEAALLPFQIVKLERPAGNADIVNPLEQNFAGYINFRFPESGLVMFLEYGRNEGPESFDDFILHPDHSSAFIFGLRKYGIFNNYNLFAGIEYANIIQSPFWLLRETRDWYNSSQFDYNTYNGRYWAAHSGPDSDDFTIYLGYANKGLSIIPSFNYERHNVTHPFAIVDEYANTLVFDEFFGEYYIIDDRIVLRDISHFSEGKLEFRLDIRYPFYGFRLSIFIEHEILINEAFWKAGAWERKMIQEKSNIIWIGVEKYFNGFFSK